MRLCGCYPEGNSFPKMSDLTAKIQAAGATGQLLESSAKNLLAFLAKSSSPLDEASIRELADAGDWKELDNRFFRTLAFGTGGLRGKTISSAITRAEKGSRATQGLVAYAKE